MSTQLLVSSLRSLADRIESGEVSDLISIQSNALVDGSPIKQGGEMVRVRNVSESRIILMWSKDGRVDQNEAFAAYINEYLDKERDS